jgi:single-strand DNA-binding protein
MKTLNRVELIGRLAADPDMRQTTSGITVANFAVATHRLWKTPEGQEKKAVDYHRIVAWHKLGQICGEFLKKGSSVFVEGELRTRDYEAKDGGKRYITEIKADNINILTWSKSKNGQPDAELTPINKDEEVEEVD